MLKPILCLFLFQAAAFAADLPHGCERVGFLHHGRDLVLNANGKQTFYLLKNNAREPITIERHTPEDAFMAPSMKIVLTPNQWAAFASDTTNLRFQCSAQNTEEVTPISCEAALDICQYPRAKFALSNMGTYWVSKNHPLPAVIREAVKKGILLRW